MAKKRSMPGVLPASRLVGEPVVDSAGEEFGRLEELMVDLESGLIAYAVLSLRGMAGLGDRLFPLPWGMLRLESETRRISVAVDRHLLTDAPGFEPNHWPRMADRDWGAKLHSFYGLAPYWQAESQPPS